MALASVTSATILNRSVRWLTLALSWSREGISRSVCSVQVPDPASRANTRKLTELSDAFGVAVATAQSPGSCPAAVALTRTRYSFPLTSPAIAWLVAVPVWPASTQPLSGPPSATNSARVPSPLTRACANDV